MIMSRKSLTQMEKISTQIDKERNWWLCSSCTSLHIFWLFCHTATGRENKSPKIKIKNSRGTINKISREWPQIGRNQWGTVCHRFWLERKPPKLLVGSVVVLRCMGIAPAVGLSRAPFHLPIWQWTVDEATCDWPKRRWDLKAMIEFIPGEVCCRLSLRPDVETLVKLFSGQALAFGPNWNNLGSLVFKFQSCHKVFQTNENLSVV